MAAKTSWHRYGTITTSLSLNVMYIHPNISVTIKVIRSAPILQFDTQNEMILGLFLSPCVYLHVCSRTF